jgi:hypothetical protein
MLLKIASLLLVAVTHQLWQRESEILQAKYMPVYLELQSVTSVHETFYMDFGREPLMKLSTYKWCTFFNYAGCIFNGKRHGKQLVTVAEVGEFNVLLTVHRSVDVGWSQDILRPIHIYNCIQ